MAFCPSKKSLSRPLTIFHMLESVGGLSSGSGDFGLFDSLGLWRRSLFLPWWGIAPPPSSLLWLANAVNVEDEGMAEAEETSGIIVAHVQIN